MKKRLLALLLGSTMVLSAMGCGSKVSVTLPEYKGINVTSVSEEEIQNNIDSTLNSYSTLEVVERASALGDTVNFTYAGTVDGVVFDGGTITEPTDLELGSNNMIPGFEDQLVGHKAGEKFDINVTFPEGYSEELGGKAAVFAIEIFEVKETIVPELTDDFCKDNLSVSTAAEYRKQIEDALNEQQYSTSIIKYLIDNSTIEGLPQDEVEAYSDNLYNSVYQEVSYIASMYGIDPDTVLAVYYGMTADSLKLYADEYATMSIQFKYICKEIGKQEGFNVSKDEIKEFAESNYESMGYDSSSELLDKYKDEIESNLLSDKVMEFLVKEAVISAAK